MNSKAMVKMMSLRSSVPAAAMRGSSTKISFLNSSGQKMEASILPRRAAYLPQMLGADLPPMHSTSKTTNLPLTTPHANLRSESRMGIL